MPTGEAIWAYQIVPHDSWDFDAMNESIVADLPIGGATRQVLVHFNKNGFAYVLDRATGQVLSAPAYDSTLAAYFESLRTPNEPVFTHWWEPCRPSSGPGSGYGRG